MSSMSYAERATKTSNPLVKKLFTIMEEKKTNLCASVDVRTTKEFLELIEKLAPFICVVKTHIDILDDFTYDGTILPLLELKKKHNFLIFEDRKFADIGNTVKLQYSAGVYKISTWADITNAHGVTGPGIVAGLKAAAEETTTEPRGLLMLAQLSSKGSIATGEYTKQTIDIARTDKSFVVGFIAQHKVEEQEGEDWVVMTPGVGLDDKGDALGQQYRTVSEVVGKEGCDIIIVGRGLFGKGRDPLVEGKRYQEAGWNSYLNRIQ
ncbi:orotidine-5'-phosphate decarboxylase [Saccharomycopsis crataegensis]|uniref:Orotidine 5'-phosphate decarboxylase n=1 Tax=Saccharomycopsis crataegensis TaxID=43959 RepID=A0AAV5QSD7_9ASCO|nr:orotidine-5'-phosphate decarboxylase [Saccharomycopsis crataegensis]